MHQNTEQALGKKVIEENQKWQRRNGAKPGGRRCVEDSCLCCGEVGTDDAELKNRGTDKVTQQTKESARQAEINLQVLRAEGRFPQAVPGDTRV